jgi:hypothetical protein
MQSEGSFSLEKLERKKKKPKKKGSRFRNESPDQSEDIFGLARCCILQYYRTVDFGQKDFRWRENERVKERESERQRETERAKGTESVCGG